MKMIKDISTIYRKQNQKITFQTPKT